MFKSSKLHAGIATLLVALSVPAARANSYTIEDLGLNVVPYDINDKDDVAGAKNTKAIEFRAGRRNGLEFAANGGAAVGVNANGDAVGTLGLTPILWTRFGHRHVLALPGGATIGDATSISDNRTVVGTFVRSDDLEHEHCFRTLEDGTSIDLGLFEHGNICVPFAIDSAGDIIVGAAAIGEPPFGTFQAFMWRDGVLADLGTLGGDASRALGINKRGQIVGQATVSDGGAGHAFVWHQGKMKDIGSSPVFTDTSANAINDKGDIVGDAYPLGNRAVAARFADGAVISLEDEVVNLDDWSLVTAVAINNDGTIVGRGFRGSVDQSHGFLLRPQP
jgi:probable HAF family extracellular repeat protein